MDPASTQLEQVAQKLDIVCALLLRTVAKGTDQISLKDQLRILDGIGVRPIDMAKITGKTPGHVNKELAAIRKEK